MISDFGIAIPLAAICVLISAFCSGTEVALFSLRRVDREQLSRSELWVDKQILRVLERPRRSRVGTVNAGVSLALASCRAGMPLPDVTIPSFRCRTPRAE